MTFEELGLNEELVKAVAEMGFQFPTPVQEKAIPTLLKTEKDLVALAQTGTGKTAAFGLPLIQLVDKGQREVQSLILCPTRELAMQIENDLATYAKYVKGLKTLAVYGGTDIYPQIRALKSGVHIVVGTPGRVLDLIRRKELKIGNINYFVLDEADEMLNMGFKEEIDAVEEATPLEKQTLLFSATMPAAIRKIADTYMITPDEIKVGTLTSGAANLEHQYYQVFAKNRYKALRRIADVNPKIYCIVFCRTRKETKDVADSLIRDGYNADALNGDMSQNLRTQVMNRFKAKHLQILVATDVAARGVDVNDLTHVINYNLPDEMEVYIHRCGRTGRAGKSGIAVSIINTKEHRKIRQLEQLTGKKFTKKEVPTGDQIVEKQLFSLIDKIEKTDIEDADIEKFMPAILSKLEYLSKEDLIRKFIAFEFTQFSNYLENAPDLNVSSREAAESSDGRNKRGKSRDQWSRFILNVGANNNIAPVNIIGMINDFTQNRDIAVGQIEIKKKFSIFEVSAEFAEEVLDAFKGAKYQGHNIFLQLTTPSTKGGQFTKKKGRGGFKGGKSRRGGYKSKKRF